MKTKSYLIILGTIAVAVTGGILIHRHYNKPVTKEKKLSAAGPGGAGKKDKKGPCPNPDSAGMVCVDGDWRRNEKGTCVCSGNLRYSWEVKK